jgi:hypothetical protein
VKDFEYPAPLIGDELSFINSANASPIFDPLQGLSAWKVPLTSLSFYYFSY